MVSFDRANGQPDKPRELSTGMSRAFFVLCHWSAWETALVRSPEYLFPGKTPDVPLLSTTIQEMYKQAAAAAGIKKHITLCSLVTRTLASGHGVSRPAISPTSQRNALRLTHETPQLWGDYWAPPRFEPGNKVREISPLQFVRASR